ncbi:leucine-rich repeat domain-containing protein [Ruminococcus flavefaciens]|uniref:Leucine rich repeat-containing protein n=1 Tax=Ruminococcus flavefaciens TaxID=1265 RepID=A0A1M7L368_RUMFL|nr:leucine-rich repeat domain-containing protein [Ruminococcus flavefaciens]SHM71940.1 Leucine rich repeat-containing protein [Ruminococcus flavefaciens]
MYVQGKCYKCGGFLAVDETQDASVCPFCGKAFIVEKAIRSFNDNAANDIDMTKAPYTYDSDFVVERSVLVRYNGYTKKEVRIPDGISVIGEAAFQGMNNIETVFIPKGVEVISGGAFSGCKNLHTIHISEGVETIDIDAFNGCISLKDIKFPDSILNMEASAFTGCTSLESINIPKNIELLPWRIFEGCTSLKFISIPKKVKTIEDFAFAECTSLESVNFECMHSDGDTATGIKRIGMNAFKNCTALSGINLPDTLEYIGNQAFRGCSKMKKISIPQSVKAIYPFAFADCSSLEQVTFAGDTELYKGSNPYKYGKNPATFFNCPKLLNVSYSKIQKHYWAFPAYCKSQEPINMENGRCRYCGGEFKGIIEKVCSVCKAHKDY